MCVIGLLWCGVVLSARPMKKQTHLLSLLSPHTLSALSLLSVHHRPARLTWRDAWIHTSITLVEARARAGSGAKAFPSPFSISRRATP